MILKFMKDRIMFTIVFWGMAACIIGFYQIVTNGVEVVYPIMLAAFFYIVYMSVGYLVYIIHMKNLKRMEIQSENYGSALNEYQYTYDVLRKVHSDYNSQIAEIHKQDREKKRFISAAVHNLKTPVTVSSVIVQRAKNGEINSDEALEGINPELERLAKGLDMVLELERLEEFSNDYEPIRINITEELSHIINENKALFINNHVYPVLNAEEMYVYTDLKWNKVLISQIISNAVKYSADGSEKHVFFTLEEKDNYVSLRVKDEGIGIPEYDLPRVWEAFFTGENGRQGHNSSGIGLYLCKKICDSLGHRIKIENDGECKVTICYLSKL